MQLSLAGTPTRIREGGNRRVTALRHHGNTRHIAYACASIEWLSMGACEQRAADSSAVAAVPNLSLTPTLELPPLTHEA